MKTSIRLWLRVQSNNFKLKRSYETHAII